MPAVPVLVPTGNLERERERERFLVRICGVVVFLLLLCVRVVCVCVCVYVCVGLCVCPTGFYASVVLDAWIVAQITKADLSHHLSKAIPHPFF